MKHIGIRVTRSEANDGSVAKNEMAGIRKIALKNLRNEAYNSEYFE
jgi:hypothetical protein